MPRPRKPKKKKYRPRGSGSVSFCKRLEKWETRVPRQLGRAASYHATKREAEAHLAAVIAAHHERERLPGADELLGTYLLRWVQRVEVGGRPAAVATARIMIGHAEPLFRARVGELRYQHVADWAVGLLSIVQASTARNYVGALARALDDLVPDVLAHNPARRRMPLPKRAPDTASEHYDELSAARLLRAAWGRPDYPLWELMLGTGLRVGEALGLTWEQIDLEVGLADVPDQWNRVLKAKAPTKTGRGRTVALVPRVVRALRALPEPHDGWLFPGQIKGRPLSHQHVGYLFAQLVERAGVPKLTPKALRHSFASISLAKGVPVTTVAEALGHSTPAMTLRYYAEAIRRRTGDAERALGEALDEVFGTVPGVKYQQ